MSGAAGLHPVGGAALVGPGGPAGRAARDDRAPEAIRSLEAWVLGALAGPARGLVAGAAARRRRVQLRRAAEQVQALLAQPAEVATPAALALAIRRDGFTGTAGVRLLAQLLSVPSTSVPEGSAAVLSRSLPAAGPERVMGV